MSRALRAVLAAAAALPLVGCTALTTEAVDAPGPTASTASSAAPTPDPSPTRTADPGGCEQRTGLGFLEGGDEEGHWVYWIRPEPEAELIDRGPSDTAQGTVTKDAEGHMLSYTVVDGDGSYAIGDRFCIEITSFTRYSGLDALLQAGDVLKLTVDPADLFVPKAVNR